MSVVDFLKTGKAENITFWGGSCKGTLKDAQINLFLGKMIELDCFGLWQDQWRDLNCCPDLIQSGSPCQLKLTYSIRGSHGCSPTV